MKQGEKYYCPDLLNYYGCKYREYTWSNDKYDNMLKERNVVCKTPEQASEMYDLFMDLIGGK